MDVQQINEEIKKLSDTNGISDGYHTFEELYDHRIFLFRALGNLAIMAANSVGMENNENNVWKSKLHHDGTSYDGWFIVGFHTKPGFQVSYHIPMKYWDYFDLFVERERAPEWDGHTPADVVERLKNI